MCGVEQEAAESPDPRQQPLTSRVNAAESNPQREDELTAACNCLTFDEINLYINPELPDPQVDDYFNFCVDCSEELLQIAFNILRMKSLCRAEVDKPQRDDCLT